MTHQRAAHRRRLLIKIARCAIAASLATAPRTAFAAEPDVAPTPAAATSAVPVPAPAAATSAAPASAAQAAPVAPAPIAGTPGSVAPSPTGASIAPAEPAAPVASVSFVAPPAAEQATAPTHPRRWLTITGAIVLGGAYGFNTVLFPLAAIDPPDGTNAGPSAWWYVVPVVGPFIVGAQTTNNNLGLRRLEYIDGSIQVVGIAMIVASYMYPVKTEIHTASVTYQPIISPRLVGMGGTF